MAILVYVKAFMQVKRSEETSDDVGPPADGEVSELNGQLAVKPFGGVNVMF